MTILYVGDPHGQWDRIIPPVLSYQPKAIVLLGDMGLKQAPLHVMLDPILRAGIAVYWIPGNHDGDSEPEYVNLFESDLRDANLHGRVRPIAGLAVAGLGGVFRERVWYPRKDPAALHRNAASFRRSLRSPGRGREDTGGHRKGLPLKYHVTIWPEDYDSMRNLLADVLVTHEARETHRNGFRALGELAEAMKVGVLVHGHHHTDYQGTTESGVKVIGVSEAVLSTRTAM